MINSFEVQTTLLYPTFLYPTSITLGLSYSQYKESIHHQHILPECMDLKKTKTKTKKRETFTCIWSNIVQYEIHTMREIFAFVSMKIFIFYSFTFLVFGMAKNINKQEQARSYKNCSNRKLPRVAPLTPQKRPLIVVDQYTISFLFK